MSALSNHNVIESAGGYQMSKSLRFRAAATAYLSRTPSVAGNRQKWTWSGWVKRGRLGSYNGIFSAYSDQADKNYNSALVLFNTDDTIKFTVLNNIGAGVIVANTNAVFRDPSAWYHIVIVLDTAQAVSTDGLKIYVNGILQTLTVSNYTQNATPLFNSTQLHYIGAYNVNTIWGGGLQVSDGYLADCYFIDGQALTPTSFGQTDTATGQWTAKKYTGTYGTNGFYLPFTNTSTTTTLCADASGNANNWTPNNISLTAGVTYDSMNDVPALNGGVSGTQPAGNYATLNPIDSSLTTISNAGLQCLSGASGSAIAVSTIAVNSGKWYAEFTPNGSLAANDMIGVCDSSAVITARSWNSPNGWAYYANSGQKYNNNTGAAYGATYTNGDVIGVALDCDAGAVTFYKNNVSQGVAFSTGLAGKLLQFMYGSGTASAGVGGNANFGQRPFTYTPPTGYKALCTANLPTPSIARGDAHMGISLAAGASIKSSSEALFSGTQFLEWIKDRANANNHQLLDSVRGLTAVLQSNTIAAETTYVAPTGNSIGWVWKAGSSAVSNTNGTITSSVSANQQAGFSIVSYTGAGGSGSTVGHGLGVAPKMVIVRCRNAGLYDWSVWQIGIGTTSYLVLNNTIASTVDPTLFTGSFNSTVFSIGSWAGINGILNTYIAYCFAEISGYSKFGSYTGNGSADGPFIYCGFKPRYILIKRTNASSDWYIWDTLRDTYNVVSATILTDTTAAETSVGTIDILSNGFKCRSATVVNVSAGTYIFAAFAENPFQYSNAR